MFKCWRNPVQTNEKENEIVNFCKINTLKVSKNSNYETRHTSILRIRHDSLNTKLLHVHWLNLTSNLFILWI